jgi:hypothetical protein
MPVPFTDRRPDVVSITPVLIRNLLVDMVQTSLGYPDGRVLVENMTDRRPSDGVYATVWVKRTRFLVQNDGDFDGVGLNQVLHNECLITAQFSIYGADAYGECIRLSNAVHSGQRWTDLWRYLGYAGQSEVVDISMMYGAQIQQRCMFEVTFYAYMGSRFPSDFFTSANMYIQQDNKAYDDLIPAVPDLTAPVWVDRRVTVRYPETVNVMYRFIPSGEVYINPEQKGVFLLNGTEGGIFSKTDDGGMGAVDIRFMNEVPSGSTYTVDITMANLSDTLMVLSGI